MEFRKKQTIYMQIADHICENILTSELAQGERIQSVREMASSIQVNPNTVMRSFNHLQDQGIIFNKRGIGYFVSDDALQKIKEMKKQDFINTTLPQLFHMMDLLGIDMKELEKLYQKRNSNANGKH